MHHGMTERLRAGCTAIDVSVEALTKPSRSWSLVQAPLMASQRNYFGSWMTLSWEPSTSTLPLHHIDPQTGSPDRTQRFQV